jgi:hypothetical protein
MAAHSLLEGRFTSCFVALRGLLDSKKLSNWRLNYTYNSSTITSIFSNMDGINNAQTGALQAGATAADLGANAPQWYHSVATPRDVGTNTGNNNAVTA